MVKTGVFKKIAALTAAVAMMASFALCASAAKVETTTQYTDDSKQEINVITSVSELSGPVEVTYYATNNGTVYIDQKTADDDGTVQFNYVTDAANLDVNNVKIGYTDAPAALPGDVPSYTISGEDIEAINVPTENINGTHVLTYTLPANKTFEGVTSEDATVSGAEYSATDNTITVTLSGAEGDVELTVVTDQAITIHPEAEFADAAFIVSGGARNEVAAEDEGKDVHAKADDRKLTVLAKVTEAAEYGILVSTSEIATGEMEALPAGADVYQALGRNEGTGYFAVQLIDTSVDFTEEETWLTASAQYYTAVYYKHPETGKYTVVVGEMVEIAAAAE